MKLVAFFFATWSLLSFSVAADYCSLCQFHTMCRTRNIGKNNLAPLSSQQKKGLLDLHNKLRNTVAMGDEHKGNPGKMPSAANMMKMEWDDELATIAQRLADQCFYGHDCGACRLTNPNRFNVGQNIALYEASSPITTPDLVSMADRWYSKEVGLMDKALVDRFRNGPWGHYSQIVWWNTRLVGCGASAYKDGGWYAVLLVCNYGSAANLPEAKIYEKGIPASQCPTGTAKDSTYTGLCAIKSAPPHATFPETDNKILGLPGYFMSPPKCKREGFRLQMFKAFFMDRSF